MIPNFLNKRKCNHVCKLLSEHMDGYLNSRESALIEKHLAGCSDCRSEYESLRKTVGLLSQIKSVPAPHSFAITVVRPIPYPSFFRPLRVTSVVLAVMLTLVFTGDATNILPGLSANEVLSPPSSAASATLSSVPPEGDVVTKVSGDASASSVSAGEVIPPPKVGEQGPAPQGIQEEVTRTPDGSSDLISDSPSLASQDITEEMWWLRSLELILLSAAIVASGTTLFIWHRCKKIYS